MNENKSKVNWQNTQKFNHSKTQQVFDNNFTKLQPQTVDLEESVLGAMLLEKEALTVEAMSSCLVNTAKLTNKR